MEFKYRSWHGMDAADAASKLSVDPSTGLEGDEVERRREYGDAIVILVVVFINSLIGWLQEGKAERSMEEFRRLAVLRARVLRGGVELDIEASKLVPGDIILLAAGDGVGADHACWKQRHWRLPRRRKRRRLRWNCASPSSDATLLPPRLRCSWP